jgi:hypothetical protein
MLVNLKVYNINGVYYFIYDKVELDDVDGYSVLALDITKLSELKVVKIGIPKAFWDSAVVELHIPFSLETIIENIFIFDYKFIDFYN